MKRRDVMKSIGSLAGVAAASKFLNACGSAGAPAPGKIDTLVYLMMENRSYDHVLGARSLLEGKPGDGLLSTMSNPDANGNPIAPFAAGVPTMCVPDPPHNWTAAHAQFNGGAMDGFVTQYQHSHAGGVSAMQYQTRVEMPVTWALADEYATCDRWFASVLGPTWPNRYYWTAGSSKGINNNTIQPNGFGGPTIFNRMNAIGLDWRIYYSDIPFVQLFGPIDVNTAPNTSTFNQFLDDAAKGVLPSVCYLDPPFGNADDHPPHHPILGQQFLASVYNALSQSPQWERTLLLITYDEHGGFFDHVPPPMIEDDFAAQGFGQLGIRVPAILVGPYVKKGYVSSVVRNHASALKEIENRFGTTELSLRTKVSPDLTEMLDTDRLARGAASLPITLPQLELDQWVIDSSCGFNIVLRRPDHDVLREAHDRPDLMNGFDRRAEIPELTRRIAQVAGTRIR
jgi:phospholipase C